jgi:hypothetical protein
VNVTASELNTVFKMNRRDALSTAMRLLDAREELRAATPEQILSVAAKFEAYLSAPETVMSETEAGAQ